MYTGNVKVLCESHMQVVLGTYQLCLPHITPTSLITVLYSRIKYSESVNTLVFPHNMLSVQFWKHLSLVYYTLITLFFATD